MGKKYCLVALALIISINFSYAQTNAGRSDWMPSVTIDKFNDQKSCSVFNKKEVNLIFTESNVLKISFSRRGGVAFYEYRVDQNKSNSQVNRASDVGSDWVEISDADEELSNGKKLIIRGTTFLKTPFDFEINLSGLKEAIDDMRLKCGLPARRTGAAPKFKDWPKPPDQLIQ